MTWAAMAFLAIAALLKFADIQAFERSLLTWWAIPEFLHPSVAVLVPSLELVVAGSWLLGLAPGFMKRAAVFLVVSFSLCYAGHWLFLKKPECQCMGLLGEYYSVIEEGPMVIARNVLLIMMLAVGKNPRSSLGPKALSESVANTSQETSRQFGAAGFTLIETMLVIALIGILASLVISSLGGVREFAKRASSLSNLRTHAVAATAYAGDFKDLMPYATSPTARWSVLRCPSKNIAIKVQYFEMMNRWNVAVADGYYGGSLSSKIFISPLNRFAPPGGSGVVLGTDYWYSCAFLASPEFYNESSRMNLPGQLRAVKISEIVFPQYKTVFTDDTSSIVTQIDEEGSQLVAFADGHAARGSTDEDLFYQGGDGIGSRETHGGHFPGSTYPLLHTRDGVRGRDVK